MEPTNVFRPVYRELTEEEKNLINEIKTKAQELYDLFPADAVKSKDRLEESVMWAVKGITQ